MILFQLAQTPNPVSQAVNDIYLQYGAVIFLLALGVILIFRIWFNSEQAKIERQKTNDNRDKEDIRRDASITDNAIQLTKTLETVAIQGVALAKAEGKVDLLNNQLDTEREKRQTEREELKTAIRNLASKVEGYEAEIAELKAAVNGKVKEIAALTLERDELNAQLKDRDETVLHLEKQVSTLEEEIRSLKLKADESAMQISSLAEQLKQLDPPRTGDTDKMKAVVTTTTTTEVNGSNKEFSLEESEEK